MMTPSSNLFYPKKHGLKLIRSFFCIFGAQSLPTPQSALLFSDESVSVVVLAHK